MLAILSPSDHHCLIAKYLSGLDVQQFAGAEDSSRLGLLQQKVCSPKTR